MPVATPEEANDNWSGLLFARSISSLTLFTPTEGCTTRMLGVVVSRTIGTKSLGKSNERLELIAALMGLAIVASSSV